MAVSGDGASGSNPYFIRGRHVVLIDYVTIFLQIEEPQFKPAQVKFYT